MGRKLTGNKIGNLIIIVAIILIPLMYAGLLTWAYEAPLTRISRLKAAVVNLDQPTTATINNQEKNFNLGQELMDKLLAKDAPGFGWEEADLATAKAGIADGRYRAMLVIPNNFSSQLAKLANPENPVPNPPVLRLETDDSVNYLAGSMATSVTKGLEAIVQKKGASSYIDQILVSFSPIKKGLEDGAEGANKLVDGTDKLANATKKAGNGAKSLNSGIGHLSEGAQKLTGGTHRLAQGSQSLVVGLRDLANGTVLLQNNTVTLANGVHALAIGSKDLQNGIDQYTQGMAKINDGAKKFAAQLAKSNDSQNPTLKDGASTLDAGLTQLKNGSGQIASQTPQLVGGADTLAKQLQPSTDSNHPTLKDGTAKLSEFISKLADGCTKFPGYLDPLCIKLKNELAPHGGLTGLAEKAKQLDMGMETAGKGAAKLAEGSAKLNGGIQSLNSGITQASAGAKRLNAGFDKAASEYSKLTNGLQMLKDKSSALQAGSQKLANGTNLLDGKIPAFEDGINRLTQGAQSASNGAQQIGAGVTHLDSGANRLNHGLGKAKTGAQALSEGLDQIHEGMLQANDGADKLANGLQNGADKLPNISESKAKDIAEVAGGPTIVKQVRNNPVYDNGIGFSPFFIGLGLWIGGIALFLIFPALDNRRNFGEPFFICMLRSLGTAIIFGLAQAVAVILGLQYLLHLHAAHLGTLILLCMLTSVAFVSINQACVAALGFRGRFVSVLLLCLQLTTAGATFPIETTDSFLQFLHPLLPMTYVVSSVRNLIAGGTLPLTGTILVLLGWTIASWLITAYSAYRRRGQKPMPFDPALAFPGDSTEKVVS